MFNIKLSGVLCRYIVTKSKGFFFLKVELSEGDIAYDVKLYLHPNEQSFSGLDVTAEMMWYILRESKCHKEE